MTATIKFAKHFEFLWVVHLDVVINFGKSLLRWSDRRLKYGSMRLSRRRLSIFFLITLLAAGALLFFRVMCILNALSSRHFFHEHSVLVVCVIKYGNRLPDPEQILLMEGAAWATCAT